MKSVYLIGWAITRVLFLILWYFAEPLGLACVWFKRKWQAA